MITIHHFQPHYYQPYTLPALPRDHCGFVGSKETRKKDRKGLYYDAIVPDPCQCAPHAHGWCAEHEYVVKLLDMASFVGCPAIEMPSQGTTEKYLLIGNHTREGEVIERAGLAIWEEVASRLGKVKAKKVMLILGVKAQVLQLRGLD